MSYFTDGAASLIFHRSWLLPWYMSYFTDGAASLIFHRSWLLPWYMSYFTDGAASLIFHRSWLLPWYMSYFTDGAASLIFHRSWLLPWYMSYFTDGAASLIFHRSWLLPWYMSYFTDGAASLIFHRSWLSDTVHHRLHEASRTDVKRNRRHLRRHALPQLRRAPPGGQSGRPVDEAQSRPDRVHCAHDCATPPHHVRAAQSRRKRRRARETRFSALRAQRVSADVLPRGRPGQRGWESHGVVSWLRRRGRFACCWLCRYLGEVCGWNQRLRDQVRRHPPGPPPPPPPPPLHSRRCRWRWQRRGRSAWRGSCERLGGPLPICSASPRCRSLRLLLDGVLQVCSG